MTDPRITAALDRLDEQMNRQLGQGWLVEDVLVLVSVLREVAAMHTSQGRAQITDYCTCGGGHPCPTRDALAPLTELGGTNE